jgi:adenylate kinase family enzyme
MNIYFIAGPPGIGKSTYGRELIPNHVPIVDHDLAAFSTRKKELRITLNSLRSKPTNLSIPA